jgi:hypothetical protein
VKRAKRRTQSLPVLIFVIGAAAVALAAPARFATGAGSGPAPACGDQSAAAVANAGQAPLNPAAAAATTTSLFDELGELTGQQVEAPMASETAISVALPAESSVSPPRGDLIVYTQHTPESGSEVRALNVRTGCNVLLARPGEIVRSAILDSAATGVYIHSVTRADRADFGVQRHDLSTGAVTQIAPAFVPSEEFGPIFGTELRQAVGNDALAVQSCGFAECVTRVRNHATGIVTTFDFPDQGQLIGLTRTHLVTYAACHGLPCSVLSIDVTGGTAGTLVAEAFGATLTHTGAGNGRLTIETAEGFVELDQ